MPSSHPVWVSLGVVGDPGEPEVDQDRGAPLEEHVGRLHVAVQDPDRVHAGDPLGQAAGEPVEVGPGDRALLRHVVVQAQARFFSFMSTAQNSSEGFLWLPSTPFECIAR